MELGCRMDCETMCEKRTVFEKLHPTDVIYESSLHAWSVCVYMWDDVQAGEATKLNSVLNANLRTSTVYWNNFLTC